MNIWGIRHHKQEKTLTSCPISLTELYCLTFVLSCHLQSVSGGQMTEIVSR